MPFEGCAIGPDGRLLDASEIDWVNDPDDDEPMPMATTSSMVQRSLDSFVTKPPLPARRSTRAARPSTKAIDPDNAMAIKRKTSDAPAPNPSRRLRHVSPEHEEDAATDSDTSEPDCSRGTNTEEDDPVSQGEAYEEAYEETKALGDADRKVCVHCLSEIIGSSFAKILKAMRTRTKSKSKDERTADVRTIFMKADYIRPGTGKKVIGHCCLVCKYVLIPDLNAFCNIVTDMLIRRKGESEKACFLAGSMSSLRSHIARYGVLFLAQSCHLSDQLKGARTTSKYTNPNALN